ncbi:hypothetical protein [Paenibacillus sp. SYP-B4298]|uniref:hypothetical protein n=1 Tax=Paenibacillus sp. SYP-B4298 TaxID=2996034 RepID=UPI0022DD0F95|nr:hypothetical protein [Paenibacillus sp. SYP-B4298]
MTNEKIMVCVHCHSNGHQLIERGHELSELLQSKPLHVLSIVDAAYDELHADKQYYLEQWKNKCEELGAELTVITKPNAKACELVASTAKNLGITQLVIGQPVQSRWQMLTRSSFVQELLRCVEDVDLHIVSSERVQEAAHYSGALRQHNGIS